MENDDLSGKSNTWLARIVVMLTAIVLVTAGITAYLWLRPPSGKLAAQELVFVTGQYGEQLDLMLSDASGRRMTRLSDTPDMELFPAWSPDGKTLAFVRGTPSMFAGPGGRSAASPTSGIVLMTFDDKKPKEELLVPADEAGLGRPAWSPDGRTIAFLTSSFSEGESGRLATHLVLVDVAAKTYETIPLTVTVSMLQEAPSWSPDGSALAFTALPVVLVAGEGRELPPLPESAKSGGWIYDRASRTLTRIVPEANIIRWSPTGEWLAFATDEGGGVSLVHPDGTGLLSLTNEGYLSSVAWSPDGTRLAVCGWMERQKGYSIAIIAVESGATTVFSIEGADSAPASLAWSQDGTYLAYSLFAESRGGLPEASLWVIDTQSGEMALLSDEPGMQALVAWRPAVEETEAGK